jgi:hypothetical protein
LPFRHHSKYLRSRIAKPPKCAARARISSEPARQLTQFQMRESLMTDRQDPRNDSSQLADERTMQGAAPDTNVDSASHEDRHDNRRRSVGYGWSAAGTTLVI